MLGPLRRPKRGLVEIIEVVVLFKLKALFWKTAEGHTRKPAGFGKSFSFTKTVGFFVCV